MCDRQDAVMRALGSARRLASGEDFGEAPKSAREARALPRSGCPAPRITTSYLDFILNSVANACLHQISQSSYLQKVPAKFTIRLEPSDLADKESPMIFHDGFACRRFDISSLRAGHVAREKLFEDRLREALRCSMPLWHTALHGDTIYRSTPQLWSR